MKEEFDIFNILTINRQLRFEVDFIKRRLEISENFKKMHDNPKDYINETDIFKTPAKKRSQSESARASASQRANTLKVMNKEFGPDDENVQQNFSIQMKDLMHSSENPLQRRSGESKL